MLFILKYILGTKVCLEPNEANKTYTSPSEYIMSIKKTCHLYYHNTIPLEDLLFLDHGSL